MDSIGALPAAAMNSSTDEPSSAGFWAERLARLEPRVDLRGPRPRGDGAPGVIGFELGTRHRAMIERVARGRDPETMVLFLAALMILVSRYAGRGGVVVDAPPLAARDQTNPAEGGAWVPLIGHVGLEDTIRTVILEADRAVVQSYRHPLAALWAQPGAAERLGSRGVALVFDALHGAVAAEHDLSIVIARGAGAPRVELRFAGSVFEPWFIEQLAEHYRRVLDHFDDPGLDVADIGLVTGQEQARLRSLGRPARDVGSGRGRARTLPEALSEQASRTPDRIAVVGGAPMTYGELDARATRLSRSLRRRFGTGPGSVVGVLLPKSEIAIVAIVAVLKTGAAYLPISTTTPPPHVRRVLESAGADLVVMEASWLYDLETYPGRLFAIDVQTEDEAEPRGPLGTGPSPSDLAYVIATSGSTGRPKAVGIEHEAVMRYLWWKLAYYAYPETSVNLQFAPLSFDSAVSDLFSMLLCGGKIVLVSPEQRLDACWVTEAMRAHGVTTLTAVPSLYRWLLEGVSTSGASLHVVTLAGERVTRDLVEAHRRALPHVRLINEYGPSECTVCVTAADLSASEDPDPPIGAPIDGVEVLIADERLRSSPLGVEGEICVGGAALGRGYLGAPEATRLCFVEHPLSPGQRLYRTGDRGRLRPDGQLEFVGRVDEQVKVRGNRVEPGEVEAVMLTHPSVTQAAVIGRESPTGAELVGYYAGDSGLSVASLRAHLARSLPDYMVPTHIVALEALPLNRNGKVDRAALPPPSHAPSRGAPAEAPRDEIERALTVIWGEVLQRETVGVLDDFFEIGGHSLHAAQLVARIQDVLGVCTSLRDVFLNPTVRGLGDVLRLQQGAAPAPLAPAPPAESYALSYAQMRLWLIDRLSGGGAAYNVCEALLTDEPIDRWAFDGAVRRITDRHDSLRTAFAVIDGEPRQVIQPLAALPIAHVDLSAAPDASGRLADLSRAELARSIDLASAPLWRITCVALPASRAATLVSLHHIIADGWAMDVFVRELNEAYTALRAGRAPALPELPIQYKDFAAWQRAELEDAAGARSRAYWLRKLERPSPGRGLPMDWPRGPAQTFRGACSSTRFPSSVGEALARLGQSVAASLFMVLVALVKVLIHRLAGGSDVSVGTPVTGRGHRELDLQIGLYVNTVVLRDRVEGAMSFLDLLRAVRQTVLEAHEHQAYPFDRLVADLAVPSDGHRNPLFDVMVALDQSAGSPRGASLRRWMSQDDGDLPLFETTTSKFDLTFAFMDQHRSLDVSIEYNTDLFDGGRIDRTLAQLGVLADSVIQAPGARIAELSYLPREELHAVLAHFPGPRPDRREATLLDLFEAQARRRPDAMALSGVPALRYGELDARANGVAHGLRGRHGVSRGSVVATRIDKSAWFVVAALGVLKAGAAYLPLDPSWPEARTAEILADCGVRLLLVDGAAPDAFPSAVDVRALSSPSGEAPAVQVCGADLAYLIYTSGSTGRPNGVMIEHRAVVDLLAWTTDALGIREHSRTSFCSSVGFDASVLDVWPALCAGGCVCPVPDASLLSPAELAARLTDMAISHAFLPPAVVELLAQDRIPLPEGLTLLTGGEVLKLSRAPTAPVVNLYGPTECTVIATWAPVDPDHLASIPIGRPRRGAQVFLLDDELRPVGIGIDGEICIGGAGLARGYVGAGDRTAQRFVPHLFAEGERLYRSGDVGRFRADGTIEFRGRLDRQLKLRGFRVEPAEIERSLAEHPDVREAAVLLDEAAPGGRLVAFVVPRPGSAPEALSLSNHLRERLPGYMVPSAFARVSALPLSSNGKIDRAELLRGAPSAEPTSVGAGGAPRTELEQLLATIWAEALGADALGRQDDFFALGGNSLVAMRVVARMSAALGARIPLRALFLAPTIAAMATHLERGGDVEQDAIPLAPQPPGGAYPLTAAQAHLWRLARQLPRAGVFNIPAAIRLRGPLDVEALAYALDALSERHSMLRTRFGDLAEVPVQRVDEEARVRLDQLDLGVIAASLREREIGLVAAYEADFPFDLTREAPLRALLVRVSEADHVLLLTLHHIAGDQWSVDVIIRELGHLYAARRDGRSAALPALPVTYEDFAVWERRLAGTPSLDSLLAFWRRQLVTPAEPATGREAAPLPRLLLPTDRPRDEKLSLSVALAARALPSALCAALRETARRRSCTTFMMALAALDLVLYRATGLSDVRVGTNVATRSHPALEDLVGLFVNTLVLRTSLAGEPEPSYADVLDRVRRTVLDALAHQALPFDDLVDTLRREGLVEIEEIFRVLLLQEEAPIAPMFADLEAELLDLEVRAAAGVTLTSCDVIFVIRRDRGGIELQAVYKTSLFDAARIDALLEAFEQALGALCATPDRSIR